MRGVPMVVIPLFFDQQRNAKVMEYRGFGKMMERSKLLDEDYVRGTIGEVLNDKRYVAFSNGSAVLSWKFHITR